jgi:site-specific recombinase XerD
MSVILRQRKLPSQKIQLYLDVHHSGRRWSESLGLVLVGDRFKDREAKRVARVVRDKRQMELNEGRLGIQLGNKQKLSFLEYFERQRQAKNSASTRQSWNDAITHFKRFAGEKVTFGDLSRELFEMFKGHLLKEVSANSAQVYLARLKTALNQAIRDGLIVSSPAAFVSVRKEKRLPKFLTLAEVRQLAATPCGNENVKRAFLFSCFSGLRYSDVDGLTWGNVVDGHLVFTQRKVGSMERMPLAKEASRILESQKTDPRFSKSEQDHEEDSVFRLPRQSTVDKLLKRWAKSAGLNKSISFHKARHTFATLCLTSGNDIYTTSKLLGHRNLQTTQIYAEVIDERKQEAVNMLPSL